MAQGRKRYELEKITLHFKGGKTVKVDPDTNNCLFWGTKPGAEGYKILMQYYLSIDQPKKAELVEAIWNPPAAAKAILAGSTGAPHPQEEPEPTDPGVIIKMDGCIPQGAP